MNRLAMNLLAIILLTMTIGCSTYGRMEEQWKAYELPPLAKLPPAAVEISDHDDRMPFSQDAGSVNLSAAYEDWTSAANTPMAIARHFGVSEAALRAAAPTAANELASAEVFSKPWPLKTAEALGLLRNPAVLAADRRLQAAVESIGQVTALDAILKQYASYTQAQMVGVGPMKGADPIEKRFPFPGVTALKGQVAQANITIAAETRAATYRNTLAVIQEAYWKLVFTHEAKQITRETLTLLNHLEAVATTRYKAGKTSYQDIAKVQISRQTLAEELVNWQRRQQSQEEGFRALIGLDADTKVARPSKRSPSLRRPAASQLTALALEHRQELRRLRTQVTKMETMILMAETMIQPTLGPNLSRYANRPVQTAGTGAIRPAFSTDNTVQRGAGLPKMPWYGTQDAYLRETRQKLLALRGELVNDEAQTRFMVMERWQVLDQAVREATLYGRSVVDLSETSLSVSTREYESGKIPFAEVIDSHTLWLKSRLTLARKRSEIGRSRANMLRVVGTSWPKG